MGLVKTAKGLRALVLPRPELQRYLESQLCAENAPESAFGDLPQRLRRYALGHKVEFADELDLSCGTDFQRSTWQAIRAVPYGETRSYAWVARQIGRPGAARAVGQAMRANPIAIILPCHRVVASDGKLGGFSAGLDLKARLLALEKA
ncbi:MAG: methylated-DNA--[protein]-cysteine S-methyltransferase [Chloroflexi bacterium]|nr:methylated-DNA--[protein]-cysteine S-methyltransferase [Chloroflexota bacterium]